MLARIAVDLVILTIQHDALCVALIRRKLEPFRGEWALPGGFVREDEALIAAATRELEEETGLRAHEVGHLEQLETFGEPKRDPRGRIVSVAHLAIAANLPALHAATDAEDAQFFQVNRRPKLAFDHDLIVRRGVERARGKLEYTPLATAFCEAPFSIADLRRVYEAVWNTELDPANFHRKVKSTPGFVRPVTVKSAARSSSGEKGRPAQLYRAGNAKALIPPLVRPG